MAVSVAYLCGTSPELCTGSKGAKLNHALEGRCRTHPTRENAFSCKKRSLLAEGYTQLGPREFRLGEGPVLILTKMSHFGARLRIGKEKSRNMPLSGGGVITG